MTVSQVLTYPSQIQEDNMVPGMILMPRQPIMKAENIAGTNTLVVDLRIPPMVVCCLVLNCEPAS